MELSEIKLEIKVILKIKLNARINQIRVIFRYFNVLKIFV